MVGRAGRPQFDTEGVAVIMTSTNVGGGSQFGCLCTCQSSLPMSAPDSLLHLLCRACGIPGNSMQCSTRAATRRC